MAKMKKMRKRDMLFWGLAIVGALIVVVAAAALIEHFEPEIEDDGIGDSQTEFDISDIDIMEDSGAPEGARNPDEELSNKYEAEYNRSLENFVLLGIDKQELGESDYYRTGGQSDVITVLSINPDTKEYFLLLVNRDLAVPVENYATNGGSYGVVDEQIALSYAYGDGGRASGRNVEKSLNWLLGEDIKFSGYIAAPIPIVGKVADGVGGVEVTVKDDFSGVDDTLIVGETVNLTGIHAENYVRARMYMKESNTNALRMNRQIEFMESFINKAKTEMTAQQLIDLYADVLDMVVTDMSNSEITGLILNCHDYKLSGVYRIDGTEGERLHDARCTYYDPEEVKELVLSLYYTQSAE